MAPAYKTNQMAASLAKMSQKPNTRGAKKPLPNKSIFAPPVSWFGNHEQNDFIWLGNHEKNEYAKKNGESEQNADAAPWILFPANAAGTNNATRAAAQHAEEPPPKKAKFAFPEPPETNQPAPAGAAESKPQEACHK